jgi:maltoporin
MSRVALQFGTAGAGNLGNTVWNAWDPVDTTSMRFLAFGVADVGENLQVMPQLVYTMENPDEGDTTSTLTAVVRPVYVVNDNFTMQFEAGMAMLNNGDDTFNRYKLTVAPTLKLDTTGFWNRPELRAFLTYIGQDEELGMLSADGEDESELRLGFQAETWF